MWPYVPVVFVARGASYLCPSYMYFLGAQLQPKTGSELLRIDVTVISIRQDSVDSPHARTRLILAYKIQPYELHKKKFTKTKTSSHPIINFQQSRLPTLLPMSSLQLPTSRPWIVHTRESSCVTGECGEMSSLRQHCGGGPRQSA